MNPYDLAHQLAAAMKQSEEYKEWKNLKTEAYQDDTNRALLDEYKKLQMQLQLQVAGGQQPSAEDMEKLQKLSGVLQFNQTASSYLMAEFRFQKMLADIYKILGDVAEVDIDMLAGN